MASLVGPLIIKHKLLVVLRWTLANYCYSYQDLEIIEVEGLRSNLSLSKTNSIKVENMIFLWVLKYKFTKGLILLSQP